MEIEVNGHLPFLDVLVMKKEASLTATVYRKTTHTGRHHHYKSNHPMHVKRRVSQSLFPRASISCHKEQGSRTEVELVKRELAINAYHGKFVDLFNNKKKDDNDSKSVCMTSILYIRGISEKFKRIGERFNIKTGFKTEYT
jgi:hypothetical protein